MSTATMVLAILAGILWFSTIISIYITNVTVKPGGIPRWVIVLGAVALLVSILVPITAL